MFFRRLKMVKATLDPTMPTAVPPHEDEARANELYWTSELSVNQIAETLDLSKGTLYGMIEPLDAELACPACGERLLWPNRTARVKGMLACPAGDWEGPSEAAEVLALDARPGAPPQRAAPPHSPSGWDPSRFRTVAAGALLGAAAGLAMILWTRRR